jgi:hypothetical protein
MQHYVFERVAGKTGLPIQFELIGITNDEEKIKEWSRLDSQYMVIDCDSYEETLNDT